MSKKKDLYYIMPGTKKAARRTRLRNTIASILVGCIIAGLLALAMYYKDRL